MDATISNVFAGLKTGVLNQTTLDLLTANHSDAAILQVTANQSLLQVVTTLAGKLNTGKYSSTTPTVDADGNVHLVITAKGTTKFNFRRRFGGGIVNFEAVKWMKFATS